MAAILAIAACGCDDLGAYEDTDEYYAAFDDIVLIDGITKDVDEYSVEDYFYNKESRENFLVGEDGKYSGVEHSEYVYMAIPFNKDIDMDTFAIYFQSLDDATVYINVYVVDALPTEWKGIDDVGKNDNTTDSESSETDEVGSTETADGESSDSIEVGSTETADGESSDSTEVGSIETTDGESSETTEGVSDGTASGETSEETTEAEKVGDPDVESRIGEAVVQLEKGKWNSFMLDTFIVDGTAQASILIKEDQYLLLQFRNNSGVRVFNNELQAYVDPQTGLELEKVKITMTNMLIRALGIESDDEAEGGE